MAPNIVTKGTPSPTIGPTSHRRPMATSNAIRPPRYRRIGPRTRGTSAETVMRDSAAPEADDLNFLGHRTIDERVLLDACHDQFHRRQALEEPRQRDPPRVRDDRLTLRRQRARDALRHEARVLGFVD